MAITNPVGWFEIYVDDLERARAFYEGVFQVKLDPLESPGKIMPGIEMLMFPGDMEQYGSTGAIAKMDGVAAGGNSTMVYFSCEDCAVEAGRIEQHGGQLVQGKFSIGEHGFIAVAVDTEGNTIGLHSMA